MTVGIYNHPVSLEHVAGAGHPERPDRLRAIEDHLRDSGLLDRMRWIEIDEEAARPLLEAVHEPAYLDELEAHDRAGGGRLDPDTRMNERSLEAARRGSAGAVAATRAVLDGDLDAAFVMMRPPGHHATRDRAMGFCLTNHVAVAARWASGAGGLARVAVLDWDVHHGNGTQDIFWDDPQVLYLSMHQHPWYPGTGLVGETGGGDARGTTVNIPLPAGTAEEAYREALARVALPALERFAPELLFISAGFDAHAADPLGQMRLTAGAFHRMARDLAPVAAGPVCVLEGGYDLEATALSVGATCSALLGDDEPVALDHREVGTLDGAPEARSWLEEAVRTHGG